MRHGCQKPTIPLTTHVLGQITATWALFVSASSLALLQALSFGLINFSLKAACFDGSRGKFLEQWLPPS